MIDLYAHLNIPRNANREAIRKAYRARAKSDHPDSSSGSASKFALTKLAHDILTDATRRVKYDSTGDTSEAPIDNTQARVRETVVTALNAVLVEYAKINFDPLHCDIVGAMRQHLVNNISQLEQSASQVTAQLKRLERLVGRFKRKSKKKPAVDPNNILDALLLGNIQGGKQQLDHINAQIAIVKSAIDFLSDYEFKSDTQSLPQQMRVHLYNGAWR